MVGRGDELAALAAILDGAVGGTPGFAVLTGDPGIGKTRPASEIAAAARDRGCTVLVGRCSQDEGAPPLWPWSQALTALGHDLPVEPDAHDPGAQFRQAHAIVEVVLAEAERSKRGLSARSRAGRSFALGLCPNDQDLIASAPAPAGDLRPSRSSSWR